MTLHFSYIARYALSIQSHIHLKSFAQILTVVMKHPLNVSRSLYIGFVIAVFIVPLSSHLSCFCIKNAV